MCKLCSIHLYKYRIEMTKVDPSACCIKISNVFQNLFVYLEKKNKAALVSKTAWVLRDLVEYGCTSARRTGGSDGDRLVDAAL